MSQPSRPRRLAARAAALLILWALIHMAVICVDGCTDEDTPADVAVVLGNHVSPDGIPARRLELRLERGLALYRTGLVRELIVSGGQDPGSPPEPEIMKRWLVDHGVPPEHVIEDRSGANTHATAKFVGEYLRARGLHSAIAVSQYYHITRAKLALRRFGVEATGAHASIELETRDPWSLAREVAGFYTYLFKDYSP